MKQTLENLLRNMADQTGEFRLAVQSIDDDHVRVIIHADSVDSETLDFEVRGNELKQI